MASREASSSEVPSVCVSDAAANSVHIDINACSVCIHVTSWYAETGAAWAPAVAVMACKHIKQQCQQLGQTCRRAVGIKPLLARRQHCGKQLSAPGAQGTFEMRRAALVCLKTLCAPCAVARSLNHHILRHHHIIQLHHVFVEADHLNLVLELADRGSLLQLLHTDKHSYGVTEDYARYGGMHVYSSSHGMRPCSIAQGRFKN